MRQNDPRSRKSPAMRHFAHKERKHKGYALKSRLQSTARNSPAPHKTASSGRRPQDARMCVQLKHFPSTIDPSFIMDAGHTTFSVGQQASLPGHFDVPIVSEAAHPLAKGYQCRVRLHQSTLDKSVISLEQANALVGAIPTGDDKAPLANADQLCLLVESARIRPACSHDRHFAASMSGIRTLPHQIEAVSTVN